MKTNMKLTVLAIAVAALMSGPAFANGNEGHNNNGHNNGHHNDHGDRDREKEITNGIHNHVDSDIDLDASVTVDADLDIDSAAIAAIDNRQSISDNTGINDKLTNDASIGDDVGSDASGNLGFNVAAGDNNAQDNAAALSAADASFSFGMATADVAVNQSGMDNGTMNMGVTNNALIDGNAFSGATGNIGVNVTSGNNNEQKNALAASVATSEIAQAGINSNQVSSGNQVSNAGIVEEHTDSINVTLSGAVEGGTIARGFGGYSGTESGTSSSRGNAYQQSNLYPDTWAGDSHPSGNQTGHIDFDNQDQGAVQNPYRPGVGGFAFDTDEEGTYRGRERGDLGFVELGYADLYASLSGSVQNTTYVVVDATNTAALAGSAFSGASGNIGVNVSAGTGNLQANSLALAVAQPSTGGGGGGETP